MSLTLKLPAHLEEELKHEAEREGISIAEHIALLLSIITTFLPESETTPFRRAVTTFLAQHSLDTDLVASAFEDLLQQCLKARDDGKESSQSKHIYVNLKAWREHQQPNQPIDRPDISPDVIVHDGPPPLRQLAQKAGRIVRKQTAMGKYAHISGTSEDFAEEKKGEIARENRLKN